MNCGSIWAILKGKLAEEDFDEYVLRRFGVSTSSSVARFHQRVRRFAMGELKSATGNFHRSTLVKDNRNLKLYKGIYKGSIPNDSSSGSILVAIKKLKGDQTGFGVLYDCKQFNEEILQLEPHPYLERLLGCASNGHNLFLVHEFMEQGCLKDHLCPRGVSAKLTWDIRIKILTGAARGLAFLHSPEVNVVYRDFTVYSILLDGSYNAKIYDFGVARAHQKRMVPNPHCCGAPEGELHDRRTSMSDVYGFGEVLLQVLTGLFPVVDSKRPHAQYSLTTWAMPCLAWNFEEVIDPFLEGRYCFESAETLAKLALNCLHSYPKKRPTMQQVLETLENISS